MKIFKREKKFYFFPMNEKNFFVTIRNIQLLLFQHIENYIFHSSHFTRAYIKFYRMWYIYRNIEQDITLSTSRCYFSQYIIVRQCFCKRLNVGVYFSMYIGNSMKYYNNKYIRQKMVNHELTFLERLRRRFIVKFFSFSRIEMIIIFL